jgi:hypothetical protein
MTSARRTAAAADVLVLATIGVTALTLVQSPGTPDLGTYWLSWTDTLLRYGPIEGYAGLGSDYPPLASLLLYVAGAIGSRTLSGPEYAFLSLKLMLLLFWIATVYIVWRLIPPRASRVMDTGLIGASLLLNAVPLGYLDILMAPAFLLAVGCLVRMERAVVPRERLLAAAAFAVCFSLAMWTKWQPLIVLPFVAVFVFKRGKPERHGMVWGMLLFAALIAAVYSGQPLLALRRATQHSALSAQALNLNWIVQYVLVWLNPGLPGNLDAEGQTLIVYTPRALRWACMLLLAVSYGVCLVTYARRGRTLADLLTFAFAGFLCYLNFNRGVHENHLFVATMILAALLVLEPARRSLFVFWAVLANLNLVLFYGISGTGLGLSRTVSVDATLLFAALEVVAFVSIYTACLGRGGSALQTTDN